MRGRAMTASNHQNSKISLKKALTPIVIVLAAVAIALIALKMVALKQQSLHSNSEAPSQVEIKVGSVLPDFTLLSSPENRVVSVSDLHAKVVMLNFWATWCEACMEEMPSFAKLRDRFHGQGFEVIGVNLDENPDSAIERTRAKLKIEFPLLKDSDGKVADLFDVHAIPSTIVFDQNRKVLDLKEGGKDWFSQESIGQVQRWLSQ